jgi:TPR repeat protein
MSLKNKIVIPRIFINTLFSLIALLGNIAISEAEVNFLALADTPYSNKAYYLIQKELENLPKDAKFIIHLGDIKRKEGVCLENDYKNFRHLLRQSPIPVFVIPGDNGYDVCNNRAEAKRFWDKYVLEFEKHWKLNFAVTRQKEQKENFAFFLENTLFVGINHIEKRKQDTVQFNKTMQNNIIWIKENLKKHKDKIKTLTIFAHDFSGLKDITYDYTVCGNINLNTYAKKARFHYKYFSDNFVLLAQEFKKPILYMQGNHHCFHFDTPYKEASNIKRMVVAKIEKLPIPKITVKGNNFHIDKRVNDRINRLLKDATQGDVWSQYFLSLEKLKLGKYGEAKKWFLKASQQNFLPAKSKLAEINNFNGQDKVKYLNSLLQHKEFNSNNDSTSYENKIKEFKQELIRKSKYEVYFLLGVMHDNGHGTPQDYKQAIKYYKKASKGVGNAYYNIAGIYFNGFLDGKMDYKKARETCRKGANAGVLDCKFMLGWINFKGLGIKQNYKKAAEWFSESKSHPPSSYNLGLIHFHGMGVPEDKEKAMELFENAADLGSPQAKKMLKSLNKTQQ